MNAGIWLSLALGIFLSAPTPPPTLTLKDGRVFYLKRAPHEEHGRLVFTTLEGKTYSLDRNEVRSFVNAPPTATRTPRVLNPQDSRELGAIARQKRQREGKTTDLSGPRVTRTPPGRARSRTRVPTPARTPKPSAPPRPSATAPPAATPRS